MREQEVSESIKETKSGSAPGPDGLPYEFYKQFSPSLVPILTRAFNWYIQEKAFPLSYRKALTRLIPKVEGNQVLISYDQSSCRIVIIRFY